MRQFGLRPKKSHLKKLHPLTIFMRPYSATLHTAHTVSVMLYLQLSVHIKH